MKQMFRVRVGKTPHLLHAEPGTAFVLGESATMCGKTKITTLDGGQPVRRVKGATKCQACRRAA